jgi:hypothetical protein
MNLVGELKAQGLGNKVIADMASSSVRTRSNRKRVDFSPACADKPLRCARPVESHNAAHARPADAAEKRVVSYVGQAVFCEGDDDDA